jgi:hypothetical protein
MLTCTFYSSSNDLQDVLEELLGVLGLPSQVGEHQHSADTLQGRLSRQSGPTGLSLSLLLPFMDCRPHDSLDLESSNGGQEAMLIDPAALELTGTGDAKESIESSYGVHCVLNRGNSFESVLISHLASFPGQAPEEIIDVRLPSSCS